MRIHAKRTRTCHLFGLVAAVLLAQYACILLVHDFYPSISLPGGAGLVRDGAPARATSRLLFAVTRDGARLEVDEHDLLSGMPGHFRAQVMANGFGLAGSSRATAEELAATRAWLRERVASQLGRQDLVGLEVVGARYTPSSEGRTSHLPDSLLRIDL